MCIAALFSIARNWDQPSCLSTHDWIMKTCLFSFKSRWFSFGSCNSWISLVANLVEVTGSLKPTQSVSLSRWISPLQETVDLAILLTVTVAGRANYQPLVAQGEIRGQPAKDAKYALFPIFLPSYTPITRTCLVQDVDNTKNSLGRESRVFWGTSLRERQTWQHCENLNFWNPILQGQ